MKQYIGKLKPNEKEQLARIGKQTIKPEDRVEKTPKGNPILPIRDETNK